MRPSPFFRKFLIIIAVAVCVFYLSYRAIYTFNLTSTYAVIASVALYVAECFGIFNLFLFFLQAWDVDEPDQQPVLEGRTVDVFVPTYNEDITLLRATLEACARMDYPHKTYVLDDGRRSEVEALARDLNIHYIARPDNRHFKAGNLNYAFERTDGEFTIILDADHVPEPHFITRTIGYFADERVAFVQSPHAFYNFDSFQARLDHQSRKYWEEGHLFYYVIQPGRNHWGCPIFAGSAAIFRRSALQEVGFIATETITEDLHTSLRLTAKGWKGIAITERLVAGQAAPDITTFHAQRLRWGTGNLSILKYDNPLFISGLSLPQRLSYLGSMLHWSSGIFKLVIYATPIAMLFTGVPPVREFSWDLIITTLVYLIVSLATMKLVSNGYGSIINSELFSMVNFWTQIKSTFRALFGYGSRIFNVTPKGTAALKQRQEKSVWPYIRPHTWLMLISVFALVWGWGKLMFDPATLPFLGKYLTFLPKLGFGISDDYFRPVVPTIWVLIHFWLAYKVTQKAFWPADLRYATRHQVSANVEYVTSESDATPRFGVTLDLNDTGMALIAYERLQLGETYRFTLRAASEMVKVRGTVRSFETLAKDSQAEGYRYGIQFNNVTPPQVDAINRICLHYGVPRMYAEYDKKRAGTGFLNRLSQFQDRGLSQRRAETRNAYRMPIIINSGNTEDTAEFGTTDDLSRTATAVLLSTKVPENALVGYLITSPMGNIRGTARVLRADEQQLAGKTYYRTVLQFEEFDGQGRTTVNSLANVWEARSIKSTLQPDRKSTFSRMAKPTIFAMLIAAPLLLLELGAFKFYHSDDFVLRKLVDKSKTSVLTDAERKEIFRIRDKTLSASNPSSDRLVLLMEGLKATDSREDQLKVAELLANRAPWDNSLQQTLIYAQIKNNKFVEAEQTYRKLKIKSENGTLKDPEQLTLDLAGARLAEHKGDLDTALTRYKSVFERQPNYFPDRGTPDAVPLRQEYAGVLIKAGKYEEAKEILRAADPLNIETRRQLVHIHNTEGLRYRAEAASSRTPNPAMEERANVEFRAARQVVDDFINAVQAAPQTDMKKQEALLEAGQLMKSDIAMAQQNWDSAREIVGLVARNYNNDITKAPVDLRRRLAQATLGMGNNIEAARSFASIIEENSFELIKKNGVNDPIVYGFIDASANKDVDLTKPELKAVVDQIFVAQGNNSFTNPVYMVRYGWVLQRAGEFAKSASVLEQARNNAPNNTEVRDQLVNVYLASNNLTSAAQLLAGSNQFKAGMVTASLHLKNGDYRRAEEELRRLQRIPLGSTVGTNEVVQQKDLDEVDSLLGKTMSLQALNAPADLQQTSFDQAKLYYETMIKRNPTNIEYPARLADLYLWAADRTKHPADYNEALKRYQAILESNRFTVAVVDSDPNADISRATRASVEQGFIDAASGASELTAEQLKTAINIARLQISTDRISRNPDQDALKWSRMSWVLLRSKDPEAMKEAKLLARKAFELKPSDPQTLRELAGTLTALEDYVGGAMAYELIPNQKLEDRMELVKVYTGAKDWTKANSLLSTLIAQPDLKPEQKKQLEFQQSSILGWSGKHDESIKALDSMLIRYPDFKEAEVLRAEVTSWKKEYDTATKMFASLNTKYPTDIVIQRGFAKAAASSKDPLSPDIQTALQKLTDSAMTIQNKDIALHAHLAEVQAVKMNDPTKAKQLALKAFDLNPQDPVARKVLATSMANEKIGLYKQADVMYEGLELEGEDRFNYALIAVQAENFDAARKQARLFVEEQMPNTDQSRKARRLLAQVLTWKGDYEEALAVYEQLVKERAPDMDMRVDIAELHRFWQNYPVALAKYAELLNEDSNNTNLWIGIVDSASSAPLPLVLEQRELLLKVHDLYSPVIKDPRRLSRLAWVMLRLSDMKRANDLLDRAVLANPDQPAVRKELAGVLAAANRRQQAIEMLSPEYVFRTLDIKEILDLSDLLTAEAQLNRAEELLGAVVTEKSEKKYRLQYASVLLWNGKYPKARDILRDLARDFPQDDVIALRIAQSYLWSYDYDGALKEYTGLIQRKAETTKDPLTNQEIWRGFVDAASGFAGSSLRERPRAELGPIFSTAQRDGIFRAFEALPSVEAVLKSAQQEEMKVLMSRKLDTEVWNQEEKALQQKQLAEMKTLGESMGRLGLVLAFLGDSTRSSQAFGAALAIDKTNREIWLQYAQAMTATGNDAGARSVFEWLLATAPKKGRSLPPPEDTLTPKRNQR
ncbi:MAG: glycosyltransferase [Zavarzinella sp.]